MNQTPKRTMGTKVLIRFVAKFRKGILQGRSSAFMCWAVCAPLHSYLTGIGVECSLVHGEVNCGEYDMDHTWLELPDGTVIDPTADQFPAIDTEVYFGKLPKTYTRYKDQNKAMVYRKDLHSLEPCK